MKKILNVPYYSQYEDVKDEYWKPRACAIVGVKMTLDYFDNHLGLNVEDLIKEGVSIGGLDENKDWIHEKLVQLLRNHGMSAYRQEFISLNYEYFDKLLNIGILKIKKELEKENPILVSVPRKFEKEESFHMIVLTGFETSDSGEVKGFYYNDTDYHSEAEGKDIFVDIETFKTHWRRLAIFVK
ncbi:C39 family peptidase [Patescibacteria group bacterium]|nr:C39 family peptidase [Patescibacteria group bacterium]